MTSYNRLIREKQTQMNTRYHRLKLQQIKRSKYKDETAATRTLDLKSRFQEADKQKQIAIQNPKLLMKLNTIIDQSIPSAISKSRPPKPNVRQRSFYSFQKLGDEWKQHQYHSRIASKIPKQEQSREITKQMSSVLPSSNRDAFEGMLKLFADLNREEPEQSLFAEPQNLAERVVLCRKMVSIDEIPYLVQISTAYKRVFIIGHNLNNAKSPVLRRRMSQQRARALFGEYNYDLQVIMSKIGVQGTKIYVKIPIRQEASISRNSNSCDKEKEVFQKQNRFIRRNYYDFMEKRKEASKDYSKADPQHTVDLRKRFHSVSEQKPFKSNKTTISKRYQDQNDPRLKRFSLAVAMKKKDTHRKNNTVQINTNIPFEPKDKSQKNLGLEPDKETKFDCKVKTLGTKGKQGSGAGEAAQSKHSVQKKQQKQFRQQQKESEPQSNEYGEDFEAEEVQSQSQRRQPPSKQRLSAAKSSKKSHGPRDGQVQQYADDFQS